MSRGSKLLSGRPKQGDPRAGHSGGRPLADAVLELIWRERRMSRADIARRLDLSRSTVSDIVGSLLETGLVREVGTGESRGGRRPIVLEFQDDACVILGVDIGATHLAVALTDLRGRVISWKAENFPVRRDPDGTRARVIQLCDACLGGKHASRPLVGIGVAMPSPIDPSDPYRLSEIALPDWNGRSGLETLGPRYRVPVLIDNDANLGALAERWWGAGQDVDNFAYIKVATGIGLGHILGGEIYRGAKGLAGEIGHLAMDPHGELCACGLRGCLATLVGTPALVARATALLETYPQSVLAGAEITITTLEDAALAEDPLALQLVAEAAESLGIAVAGLLNLMNLNMVVFGGSLARLKEVLLAPLRATVHQRTFVSSAEAMILTSKLGPQTVAIGAATLVLEAALANPQRFLFAGR